MENLNNVPSTGTFGGSVSTINKNFDLVVNAINSLEYQTTRSKGILNYGKILLRSFLTPLQEIGV